MTTSNGRIQPSDSDPPRRGPLRLSLAAGAGRNRLDGAWWPRTRDLVVELADLVDHFPEGTARIVGASCSTADWDRPPRRVAVAGGHVQVGALPHDDLHLTRLTLADRTVLQVLVVPPGFTDDQGAEALLAAAAAGNAHSAAELLEEVTDSPDDDPRDRWTDHGDSWWEPAAGPPSFRAGS